MDSSTFSNLSFRFTMGITPWSGFWQNEAQAPIPLSSHDPLQLQHQEQPGLTPCLTCHILVQNTCYQGVYSLTGWLMKAKKSPWETSGIGQSWKQAGERYLEIATWLTAHSYLCSLFLDTTQLQKFEMQTRPHQMIFCSNSWDLPS